MIETEVRGAMGWITLARPEVRNALNGELMQAFAAALDRMTEDDRVRAVVVTGAGSAFSAGADLASMRQTAALGREGNRADARTMGGLFHKLAGLPKPVLARVNGPAIGGGVGLMAACDLVVAVATARFQFSEVRLGLVPAVISPFCIRRLGATVAKRMFLTGEAIDAEQARAYGLVDEVAAPDALDAAVERILAQLALAGPRALVAAKRLVDTVVGLGAEDALDYTADLIADLRASDEAQAGMQAFLTKTSPPWATGSAKG